MQRDTDSDRNREQEVHQSKVKLVISPRMRPHSKIINLAVLDRTTNKKEKLFFEILGI